ncbi:MAG: hypothetical protein KC618_07185 [Candidatus Omnitrophica bacterium]|nr:hypothetical protein [Candidatus Omnitrophota bacterium]
MKKLSLLFLLVSFLTVNTAFAKDHNYKKDLRYKYWKEYRFDTADKKDKGDGGTTIQVSGLVGVGADMWTASISHLFAPHEDTCDPLVEAFVVMTPDGKGFCVEIDARAAKFWENARHECIEEGKRLPEVAELKYVCINSAEYGISVGNSGSEWSSNFVLLGDDAAGAGKVTVAAMGSSSCNSLKAGRISKDDFGGKPEAYAFRCVR